MICKCFHLQLFENLEKKNREEGQKNEPLVHIWWENDDGKREEASRFYKGAQLVSTPSGLGHLAGS